MEMLVIRYMATEVLIFAYFKNLALMSAFLGLSLGFIKAPESRDYFKWSGLAFLFLCGLLVAALPLGLTFMSFADPFQFMLFGVGGATGTQAWHGATMGRSLGTLVVMLGLFSLSAFSFVGPGQRMGQLFRQLWPLEAYSVNILGALAGTALFSLMSWLETSPGVWIAVTGLLFLLVELRPSHFALCLLGIVYAVWLGPFIARAYYGADYVKTIWSPYYRIDVVESHPAGAMGRKLRYGYDLRIGYDTFQTILDCSAESLARFPQPVQDAMVNIFSVPYRILPRVPEKVLILAAGNGTDTAAAISAGVKEVDAVDIDPVIGRLGKTLHPQRPYLAPGVRLKIMDARTFLKTAKDKYDAIVFAYLDSHTAFSCLSSLRTDNYIFTKQAYQEAAKLLKENGYIYVSFICFKDWLWDRHARALAEATGMVPLGYCNNNGNVDVGYLIAGPAVRGKKASDLNMPFAARTVELNQATDLATDDWPFLFLPARALSATYMLPLFSVLSLSLLLFLGHFRSGSSDALNWEMFLLGTGFMLLEVRAMADLSLLFGSTWAVSSFVISGVMVVILVGNWLATRLHLGHLVPVGLLLVLALLLSTAIRVSELTAFGELAGRMLAVLFYIFPVAFAATMFALFFKNASISSTALAFNLFGGLVGICLEYVSMWLGIHALAWIAVAIYSACLVLYWLKKASLVQARAANG